MLPVCRTLIRSALVISLSHLAWCQPVGWNELWDNHLPQSRSQFQEQLRAQPDHPDALRGLGWVCQMEGDFAGVLQSWGHLVEMHPDLPQALAVWPEVSEAAARLGRTAWLAQLSTRLLENPRTLPVLKDCARGTLAALRSTASDALPRDAAVLQWKAIGPFGNGSGFEKVLAVEEGGPPKATLAGKNGLQLRWQKLQSPGREFNLGQLSRDDDSLFYLASALTSVEAGPAELSIDALGAMKLWLNGKLVFLHSSYGDNAGLEMPFRVPVQLQSGPNTLVVKMANRDAHSPSFVLLLRDAQGEPLKFEAHPELADLSSPLTGQIPESVPQGVGQMQRVTGEPDSGLWLARHLALNGQAEDAVAEGRRALQQHPHSALIQWELSQRLNEDGLTDEARQLRNQALESVPSLFQANLDRLEDEADGQTQLTGLRQMVGRQPDDFDTQMQLYRTHIAAENDGEAQKVLLALAQRQQSPDNLSTLILYMNLENMNAEALKLLARGLQQYPFNTTLRRLELRQLVKEGKLTEAIAAATRLLQQEPDSSIWQTLADLYRQSSDLPQALHCLSEARDLRPQDGELLADLADLQQEMGKPTEAKATLEEALAVDPSKVSLREKLRAVAGEKPALDWLTPPLPFDLAHASTSHKESVVYLLDEERMVIYPDSAAISVYRGVIKVNDERGAEALSRMRAPRDGVNDRATLEVARIRKADGHIQDVRDRGNARGISFPSLQAGDIVDVQWRIESVPGSLPHVWTWWNFDVEGSPVEQSHLVLAHPKGMALKEKTWGAVPAAAQSQKDDWMVRKWRMHKLPALPSYEMAAPVNDRARRVEFSNVPDWKAVVGWYLDLSGPLCRADEASRKKSLELTKGLTREEDKIAAIQRFVASGLRYQTTPFRNSAFVPTPSKEVLNEGFGDCKDKAALICAMLDALGIKAQISLVSTRSNGTHPHLPSPWFNHAIVKVDSSSGPLWIDGTVVQTDLRSLPQEDQQVPALIVDPSSTGLTLTPLSALKSNYTERRNIGKLDSQGNLEGHFGLRGQGLTVETLRAYLKNVTAGDYGTVGGQIAKEMTGPRSEATKTEFGGMQDPSEPMSIDLDYRCPGYAIQVENSWLIPSPFGSTRRLSATRDRIQHCKGQPVDVMAMRGQEDTRFELTLPAGVTLAKPRVFHQTNSTGSFRATLSQQDNKLVAQLLVEFQATRLQKNQTEELAQLLTSLEATLNKPLLLLVRH